MKFLIKIFINNNIKMLENVNRNEVIQIFHTHKIKTYLFIYL